MDTETAPTCLRLLSLNCLGVPFLGNTRARLQTLGRSLNEADLDVICLQEIQYSGYLPLLRQRLTTYPHVAYEPFLHAPKGGLVTFSRWPIERRQFTLYRARGPIHTPAMADWLLHKGILTTRVRLGETEATVINTHLVANYSGDWSNLNLYTRYQQAELHQLARVVNALDRQAPLVVAGDFNVPRGNWLYRDFVAATNLLDPLAENTEPTYRRAFLVPGRYAHAIDHVFVRPGERQTLAMTARLAFEEKSHLVNGSRAYISDHLGIEAEFQWRATGAEPS